MMEKAELASSYISMQKVAKIVQIVNLIRFSSKKAKLIELYIEMAFE